MRRTALVLSLLALAPPAGANGPEPQPKPADPEIVAVLAYGASHPECLGWTDGCVICARGEGAIHCSTPGIACQPGETVCKRPEK